ncbi:MAG: hypothetical protein WC756_08045 [Taibaiella sp.]|jgi:hypothetical protein
MSLTPTQAAQILAALAGKVDNATLAVVKKLLETATITNNFPPGDTYQQIKSYSQRLLAQYQTLGTGVATSNPHDETMVVYMEPDKLKRLFMSVPSDGYIAALPGIHHGTGNDHLTISLLGTDKNMNILPEHISGGVCGEESWPNLNVMSNLDLVLPNL